MAASHSLPSTAQAKNILMFLDYSYVSFWLLFSKCTPGVEGRKDNKPPLAHHIGTSVAFSSRIRGVVLLYTSVPPTQETTS